jgi:hypothetical protein
MSGGSIESISLAGREFAVASDAATQRKLGGVENEVLANGNGSARDIKTRVPWSLTDISVVIDDDYGDQEYLQELADASGFFVIAVTYASGAVYQGTGQIIGEVQYDNMASTASLSLSGPNTLTIQ